MQHDDMLGPTALPGTRRQQIRLKVLLVTENYSEENEKIVIIFTVPAVSLLLVNRGIMGSVPPMGSLAWVHSNVWTNK
jgi:hypothetical protein